MASITSGPFQGGRAGENRQARPHRYRDNIYFQDGHLLTILLTLLLYLIVAVSLESAGYVDNMSLLLPVTVGAFASGLLMSFSRFDGFFGLSHGLFTGLAWILYWVSKLVGPAQIQPFIDNGIPELQAKAYFVLLQWLNWVDAAFNGVPNEDNFVFIFEIAFLIWWLTFLGVWSIFRYGYTWRAIVPAGVVLVVNTYYAPDDVGAGLILFSMLALVLLTRTNLAEQQLHWRERRIYFSPDITLDFMRNAVIYGLVIVAIAWMIPEMGRNLQVRSVLSPLNDRWEETSQRWNRLYEGLNRQTTPTIATFGRSLSLGGARNVGNEPVFQVNTSSGRYWRAVAFDTYNGRQWLNTNEEEVNFDADTRLPVAGWSLRQPVTQTITLLGPTGSVIFGSQDILQADLPLNAVVRPLSATSLLGDDVQPVEFSLTRTNRILEVGDKYTVISNFSLVTERALQAASSLYPDGIIDKYLQLPENFSVRVAEDALALTAEEETVYDKTKTIERFLRGFAYNENIEAPPPGADPVEYFLYDIQQGYCDYYATSMALMLRSLGIPARTASGYAEGTFDEESGLTFVTQRDAHTWVEVYFPDYGWVEFEPTAGESELSRPRGEDPALLEDPNSSINSSNVDGSLVDEAPLEELNDNFNIPQDEELSSLAGSGTTGTRLRWLWLLLTPLLLIGAVVALLRMRLIGPTSFSSDIPPLLYERMHYWFEWLGLRQPGSQDTPYEHAARLGHALPEGKPPDRPDYRELCHLSVRQRALQTNGSLY